MFRSKHSPGEIWLTTQNQRLFRFSMQRHSFTYLFNLWIRLSLGREKTLTDLSGSEVHRASDGNWVSRVRFRKVTPCPLPPWRGIKQAKCLLNSLQPNHQRL